MEGTSNYTNVKAVRIIKFIYTGGTYSEAEPSFQINDKFLLRKRYLSFTKLGQPSFFHEFQFSSVFNICCRNITFHIITVIITLKVGPTDIN